MLLCGEAVVSHQRSGEELERDLALRRSEEGSTPRVVAREFTGASVDLQSPVRTGLFEDGPVKLLNLVPKGARAGVEDGFGGVSGEASSGDRVFACLLDSFLLRYTYNTPIRGCLVESGVGLL